MSKYFKNKISYNHVLLLSIIACYFLFLLCFYYANKGQDTVPQADSKIDKYLIMTNIGLASDDLQSLDGYLNSHNDQILKTTHVKGDEVMNYFDFSPNLFSDSAIDVTEMFSDHYIIALNHKDIDRNNVLIDSIKLMSGVADISVIENDALSQVVSASVSQQLSLTAIIILMILTLALIYIGLSLDFQRNRDSLKSLIMKGATQKYLMSTYQKKGLLLSIKTWIGGLVLFFMSFYLLRFNTYSDLSIFEFKFLGIVCLVPLALIIFITSFVIYTKIMTLIRE